MGFLDDAGDFIGRGAAAARGAASSFAGEQLPFVRSFVRMCDDGWHAGYHESNGGNASLWLTVGEVEQMRPLFYDTPGSWVAFSQPTPSMAGEYLIVTGSGKHLRNVATDTISNIGVVQVNSTGESWRVVWGLRNGGLPTSELAAHVASFAAMRADGREGVRVLYHAHPSAVVALTKLFSGDWRDLTLLLWSAHSEGIVAFPRGVYFVPFATPGTAELARLTAGGMALCDACVWQHHGVFASGCDCDAAFGVVAAIDKAADVHLKALAANGGIEPPYTISKADLLAITKAYGLAIHDEVLA